MGLAWFRCRERRVNALQLVNRMALQNVVDIDVEHMRVRPDVSEGRVPGITSSEQWPSLHILGLGG